AEKGTVHLDSSQQEKAEFRALWQILFTKQHGRTRDEQPPSAVRIASPYDPEARYSSKRDTPWVGHKLHLTETCDPGQPDLITQVLTTPATTPDCVMGPTIHHDPPQPDLLPGTHL